MKKINNIFRYSLLSLLALVVSVGCQKEMDDLVPTERRSVMMEVSVSAGGLTRSLPTEAEKSINTLRIYAFYGEQLVGYLDKKEVLSEEDAYYIDLELPENGTYDVDFYVIANEEEMAYENASVSLSPSMGKSELEAIKFTGLTTGSALPMYCKQTEAINVDNISDVANSVTGHEGHFILSQKVEFKLTRSLAKLSVYAAKVEGATSNPQILNITLLAIGTREYSYLFPQSDETLNAVPSRANNRPLFSSVATISKTIASSDVDARANTSNYDEVFSGAYMPEVAYGSNQWNISSGNVREAVLHIEYTLGEGQELRNAYVYLPRVERNHHIKVCILINSEGEIIITYEVADWDDNASSSYSFAYPTHSFLMQNIPSSQEELAAKPSQRAQISETQPFVGYFQMTTPDSDRWTPTLLGLNANNCYIRVYEGDTQNEVTDEIPLLASDKWYRIEVHFQEGKMEVGDEVQLAISYTALGVESREFLLINGTYQEYYWPYDGVSPQDANYVIITTVN